MPRVREAGGMSGFGGVYGRRPDLFRGFMFNYGVLWSHSTLDPLLKELIRLYSSNTNGCRY